jgi:hypothetical protein
VVSSNQKKKCGKRAKPQVTPYEITPKNCYEAVGGLFKSKQKTFINSSIHTYPHLIPSLGVVGWG